MKETFYKVRKLLELYPDAQYYMIVGGRSGGKTYSLMKYFLEEDIKSKRSAIIFKGLNDNGLVKRLQNETTEQESD